MLSSLLHRHPFLSSILPFDNAKPTHTPNPKSTTNHKPTTTATRSESNVHESRETRKGKKKKEKEHERCAHEERPDDMEAPSSSNHYAVKNASVRIITGVLFGSLLKPVSKEQRKSVFEDLIIPSSPSSSSCSSPPFRFHFQQTAEGADVVDPSHLDSATPENSCSDSEADDEGDEVESEPDTSVIKPLPRLVLSSVALQMTLPGQPKDWSHTPRSIFTPSAVSHNEVDLETVAEKQATSIQQSTETATAPARRKRGHMTVKQKREVERDEAKRQQQRDVAHKARRFARLQHRQHKMSRNQEDRELQRKFEEIYELPDLLKKPASDEEDDTWGQFPSNSDKQARAQMRAEERSHGKEKRERTRSRGDS